MCITQTGANQLAGFYLPHATSGLDYTVSVKGRLASGWGWGVLARAADNGELIGHGIQYEDNSGGVRDVDFPSSNTGHLYFYHTDNDWHTLMVTVRGSQYTLQVDGAIIVQGSLSETDNGAFIRVWNQATAEIQTPVVTAIG